MKQEKKKKLPRQTVHLPLFFAKRVLAASKTFFGRHQKKTFFGRFFNFFIFWPLF